MAKKKSEEKEISNLEKDLKVILEGDEMEEVNEFIPTGSTLLDYAIANRENGGVPVGRITEIIGENSSGKTLLCAHLAANAQKKNGVVIFIDTEHSFDKGFSVRIGINHQKGFVYKENVDCLEEVFIYIDKTITTIRQQFPNVLTLIIWDSISATPARIELEDDYDPTKQMALQARIMSKALRKICGIIKKERIALVVTNQLRTKIGVAFGDPDTTSHGRAMSFYASVRMKLSTRQKIINPKTKDVLGIHMVVKIFKNKLGPGFRTVEMPIFYDYGISDKQSWLAYLEELEIVSGTAWKKIIADGKEYSFQTSSWLKTLKENPELEEFILKKIGSKMIITYGPKEDLDIDLGSFLEVDQVASDLEKNDKVFEEE
jgi:recombination protein RecA